MKTIDIDLTRDQQFDVLAERVQKQKIKIGHEPFQLKIHTNHEVNMMLYACFLLILTEYLIEAREKETEGSDMEGHSVNEPRMAYNAGNIYHTFYFKTYDVEKLEEKIEKDFMVGIEMESRNPLDEVFGIWKEEDTSLDKIRNKAWRRTK